MWIESPEWYPSRESRISAGVGKIRLKVGDGGFGFCCFENNEAAVVKPDFEVGFEG